MKEKEIKETVPNKKSMCFQVKIFEKEEVGRNSEEKHCVDISSDPRESVTAYG